MLLAGIAMRSAKPGVMALLLVAAVEAAAQAYRPASLDGVERAPPHVLGLSPSAVRALHQEHEMDLQAFDGFDGFGGKRRADGIRVLERPAPWTLYGRFGLVKFQNELDPHSSGMQLTWRNTGPGLGGKKLFVGLRRSF
jgi:hypothetical protein